MSYEFNVLICLQTIFFFFLQGFKYSFFIIYFYLIIGLNRHLIMASLILESFYFLFFIQDRILL